MVTATQAQQAADLAAQITTLETSIAQLQSVIAANMTVSRVFVYFNETKAVARIPNSLTQSDTTALLTAGLNILQGYLTTAQAALAAIS